LAKDKSNEGNGVKVGDEGGGPRPTPKSNAMDVVPASGQPTAGYTGPLQDKMPYAYDGNSFMYLLKFIIVGSVNVGKSCLLLQFTDRRYQEQYRPTIGVDFGSQVVFVDGNPIKVQVWDTAGQEDFRAITRAYYREAAAALIVYDVSHRKSFKRIKSWLHAVTTNSTNDHVAITLVGNKCDLTDDKRVVARKEGEDFAREHGLRFIETSAKFGTNVDKAFVMTAQDVYRKIQNKEIDPSNTRTGIRPGNMQRKGKGGSKTTNLHDGRENKSCC